MGYTILGVLALLILAPILAYSVGRAWHRSYFVEITNVKYKELDKEGSNK